MRALETAGEQSGPKRPLEIARSRELPTFFILDEQLNVVFQSEFVRGPREGRLPDGVLTIAGTLRDEVDADPAGAMAVLSPSRIVRMQRLAGGDGTHYALFIERFAPRNSLRRAAERYKLSRRETEVLEGLVLGEATNEIANRLGISPTTVQEHVRKIGRKTNTTRRSAIIATVFGLR